MEKICIDALKYGVIGLSFLLAFLAYLLLKNEQSKKEVRTNILKAVYIFMGFSIVLCCIGLFAEFINKVSKEDDIQKIEAKYVEKLKSAESETAKFKEERDKYLSKLGVVSSTIKGLIDAKVGLVNKLPEDDPSVKTIKETLKSLDASVKQQLLE